MPPVASATSPLARASLPRARREALVRALAFLAAAVALTVAGLFVLTTVVRLHVDPDHAPISILLSAQVALVLFTVVAPSALVAVTLRPAPLDFGWGRPSRPRQLLAGVVGGALLMSLVIGSIAALGGVRLSAPSIAPLIALRYGAAYAAIFGLTAISEEGLFRGYVLIQLSRAVSFWPAAVVTSLLFLATHLFHANETVMGLAQVGLFGLVMAFSVWKSGGLWFALGFHAAWDFTETFVYGVPDSGLASAASLFASRFEGSAWLTGGPAGPEGSALVFPALAILAAAIHLGFQTRRPRMEPSGVTPDG